MSVAIRSQVLRCMCCSTAVMWWQSWANFCCFDTCGLVLLCNNRWEAFKKSLAVISLRLIWTEINMLDCIFHIICSANACYCPFRNSCFSLVKTFMSVSQQHFGIAQSNIAFLLSSCRWRAWSRSGYWPDQAGQAHSSAKFRLYQTAVCLRSEARFWDIVWREPASCSGNCLCISSLTVCTLAVPA